MLDHGLTQWMLYCCKAEQTQGSRFCEHFELLEEIARLQRPLFFGHTLAETSRRIEAYCDYL